jgi:hypothetical protein
MRPGTWEAEAGGLKVQECLGLQSEFKACPGNETLMRPYLYKEKRKEKERKGKKSERSGLVE